MMRWQSWVAAATMLAMAGCGDDDPLEDSRAQPVLDRYGALVYSRYSDALSKANALKAAVDAFTVTQTAEAFEAAKNAWLAARNPYSETEAFRFYGGPIDDDEDGPEGRLNAWPLDESYIDYVDGNPTAGIINHPELYPEITEQLLIDRNERDGETNIATGYHAIEFLLWGQDQSSAGPGARPYTDFVDGGTAQNQARRRAYLSVVTTLLVKDLDSVQKQWAPGTVNYRSDFVAEAPKEAILKMLTGMGSLSGAELSGERMNVAYENKNQEDEHSCFSDNTLNDLKFNALSVEDVYLGRFGGSDGPGLADLVAAVDPQLNDTLKARFAASNEAISAIPAPFDQAILGDDAAPGRAKVKSAIQALQSETDGIVAAAAALGVQLSLDTE